MSSKPVLGSLKGNSFLMLQGSIIFYFQTWGVTYRKYFATHLMENKLWCSALHWARKFVQSARSSCKM